MGTGQYDPTIQMIKFTLITLTGFYCIKINRFSGKEKVVDNYFTFFKPEAEFWEKAGTNISIRLLALPKESR